MSISILIDGNNLAYRCCATMTNLSTKDGFATGGIFGTLNLIGNYIKDLEELAEEPITECIVAYDGGRSKRRLDMFPEYKGGRKTDDDRTEEEKKFYHDFIGQTKVLNENLPLLGVKTIQLKGWEADDLIYGYIKTASECREDVESNFIIISTDEDFLQLISPNTAVYSPIKQIYYTYDNFEELFGCKPESFISYKILKGDSSDNINGIQGIGDKTGKKLVNEYGDLAGILNPDNRDVLMKSKVTQRIFTMDGLSTLDRNNQLINLKEYVDLKDVAEVLEDLVWENPAVDEKAVRELLMKYQLSSILVKFKDWIKSYKLMIENYYKV